MMRGRSILMLERTCKRAVALEQGGDIQFYERQKTMGYKAPFHSKKPNTPNVYHNNDKCTEGNNIESYNLVQGTGNRPLCHHCSKLNAEGK
jgi:hypothetical protein